MFASASFFSVTWFLINTLVTSAKAREAGEKFSAHLCDLSNNEDKLETASVKLLLHRKKIQSFHLCGRNVELVKCDCLLVVQWMIVVYPVRFKTFYKTNRN